VPVAIVDVAAIQALVARDVAAEDANVEVTIFLAAAAARVAGQWPASGAWELRVVADYGWCAVTPRHSRGKLDVMKLVALVAGVPGTTRSWGIMEKSGARGGLTPRRVRPRPGDWILWFRRRSFKHKHPNHCACVSVHSSLLLACLPSLSPPRPASRRPMIRSEIVTLGPRSRFARCSASNRHARNMCASTPCATSAPTTEPTTVQLSSPPDFGPDVWPTGHPLGIALTKPRVSRPFAMPSVPGRSQLAPPSTSVLNGAERSGMMARASWVPRPMVPMNGPGHVGPTNPLTGATSPT
jgi:hypothetical protein